MSAHKSRAIALIVGMLMILGFTLTACGMSGETPTGDISTPGVSSVPERANKTVSVKAEDRQGGEFGGNAGTSYSQSKSMLTYDGCNYYVGEKGSKLYKISADGTVTELDISSMESVHEGYGPLLGLLFVCDGKLYDISGNWISVDGKETGKWDNDNSFAYYWAVGFGFFVGDRLYYIESDVEYRPGIEPFSVIADDYTEEEIDRIFEEHEEQKYSGIVSAPLNEILEPPPHERFVGYTPSTVIKSFENERDHYHQILFVDNEWIYYYARKDETVFDDPVYIYRVSLDGEKENFIFETNANNYKNLNFIGDYVYYIERADSFTNLLRRKADGTGSAEIVLGNVVLNSLNSYGDSLYLELDGIFNQSSTNPFLSTGTMYIAKLKVADAVPGTSTEELFAKTQRFDIQKKLTPGMWQATDIWISGGWIVYTSNIDGKTKMLKDDFSAEHDMPGQDSVTQAPMGR